VAKSDEQKTEWIFILDCFVRAEGLNTHMRVVNGEGSTRINEEFRKLEN
jgi:hypothetical protein